MPSPLSNDEDAGKGAVEQDRPEQETNVNFAGQNPHRTENRLVKANDTDYPEPGENPEHSGELMAQDKDRTQQHPPVQKGNDQRKQGVNPEGQIQDQDPGHRQKENQNQKKDDDLAA
jgi:hypothetical protein